jgi:hypothetical protein
MITGSEPQPRHLAEAACCCWTNCRHPQGRPAVPGSFCAQEKDLHLVRVQHREYSWIEGHVLPLACALTGGAGKGKHSALRQVETDADAIERRLEQDESSAVQHPACPPRRSDRERRWFAELSRGDWPMPLGRKPWVHDSSFSGSLLATATDQDELSGRREAGDHRVQSRPLFYSGSGAEHVDPIGGVQQGAACTPGAGRRRPVPLDPVQVGVDRMDGS